MEQDDDFFIEEEQLGSRSGGESVAESSCPTEESTIQQTKKRRRQPAVKVEGTKKTKMGCKGKAGNVLAGWLRPLFVHDEDGRLVCNSPTRRC